MNVKLIRMKLFAEIVANQHCHVIEVIDMLFHQTSEVGTNFCSLSCCYTMVTCIYLHAKDALTLIRVLLSIFTSLWQRLKKDLSLLMYFSESLGNSKRVFYAKIAENSIRFLYERSGNLSKIVSYTYS